MALRVTLDVFSGRPNPVLVLDGGEEREVLARLGARSAEPAAALPPHSFLGYRGLRFEQVEQVTNDLPRAFRLLDGVLLSPGSGVRIADSGVEEWITDAAGPAGRLQLGAEFHRRLEVERRRERPRGGDGDQDDGRERQAAIEPCPAAPVYEPAWWNDRGPRQFSNNCYNYATGCATDTFAQPGRAGGHHSGSWRGSDVLAGAVADELVDDPDADNRCPAEGYLVALAMAPDWDFHWYRKGRAGFWSHKPGGTRVTNRDNSGGLIADPRAADRGPYGGFCTFMVVRPGRVDVR
jgi:hypothetical protein